MLFFGKNTDFEEILKTPYRYSMHMTRTSGREVVRSPAGKDLNESGAVVNLVVTEIVDSPIIHS